MWCFWSILVGGGGMLGLVIISQRDRIEQYQSNKYGSLCSSSSIRILSIQTGVHMMERLVMRWRWYWTLTSSILLLFAFNEYYYLYIQLITSNNIVYKNWNRKTSPHFSSMILCATSYDSFDVVIVQTRLELYFPPFYLKCIENLDY